MPLRPMLWPYLRGWGWGAAGQGAVSSQQAGGADGRVAGGAGGLFGGRGGGSGRPARAWRCLAGRSPVRDVFVGALDLVAAPCGQGWGGGLSGGGPGAKKRAGGGGVSATRAQRATRRRVHPACTHRSCHRSRGRCPPGRRRPSLQPGGSSSSSQGRGGGSRGAGKAAAGERKAAPSLQETRPQGPPGRRAHPCSGRATGSRTCRGVRSPGWACRQGGRGCKQQRLRQGRAGLSMHGAGVGGQPPRRRQVRAPWRVALSAALTRRSRGGCPLRAQAGAQGGG
jgi:hypothetical protein